MASDYHEVFGQSIKGLSDLNALLLAAKEKDVIHIDEAHELEKRLQTALYLAVDRQKVLVHGSVNNGVPLGIGIADFTLLLSTTDEYCLLQPLRDRMRLTLRFDFYSADELMLVLRHRSRALAWATADDVLPAIAQRARGTPRLALRLLQSARRVARSENESTVELAHVERACALEQLDEIGLGPTEQKYLRILSDGAARLNVLASVLGLPGRTVSHVTEPFLVRARLIVKDDQGRRQLTAAGHEHLSKSRQIIV
jgi:Holliday junction DNA helicase RuvB